MGFLKKIFKPVSKVLDKVIPNEIKPALPYLAAFAPMFGPTSAMMGSGIMQRALISGGLNIGSQLAQEGNEGDINLLSAGLGALTGAMTAPGGTSADFSAAGPMEGPALTKTPGFQDYMQRGIDKYGAESAIGEIAKAGIKSADFMQAPGLMKYGIPTATATGDLMFAQAKRDQDAYDDEMAAESEAEGASNAQRAAAIRQSMESYGFTEEEIEDAIYAAGYKTGGRVGLMQGGLGALGDGTEESESEPETFNFDGSNIQILMPDNNPKIIGESTQGGENMLLIEVNGNTMMISEDAFYDKFGESKAKGGRVGLRFGGIGAAVENIEDTEMKESAKFAMQDMDVPIMELVQEFEIKFKRKPNSLEELKQYYKDKYKGTGDVSMQEEIKEKVVMEAKDGGLMNLGGKEMDMRSGGFIPIGKKERADDVPARLSKNEFVMTADAVRAAGGGSVNEGAKRMYETMNKLEARA